MTPIKASSIGLKLGVKRMNACQRDELGAGTTLMSIVLLFMKNSGETTMLLTKNNRLQPALHRPTGL